MSDKEMISVTWRYRYLDPVYGDPRTSDEKAEVPRIPRVGDYVWEWRVIAVIWSERMDRAIVELRKDGR